MLATDSMSPVLPLHRLTDPERTLGGLGLEQPDNYPRSVALPLLERYFAGFTRRLA